MEYEKELGILKENLDKAKTLKYKAEARLEQLKKQEEDLINELKDLNVNPEDLDNEIENLTKDIDDLFEQSNKLMPKDILEKK